MPFNDYFVSIPFLETERCYLTAFSRTDMDEYFDIIRNDMVVRYLGHAIAVFDKEPHITNWLNNINNRLLKKKLVLTWCVKDKATLAVIGRIDLGGFIRKTAAEISYHFSQKWWGMGIATEVVKEITRFGFEQLELMRIQGIVHKDNAASLSVLLKNGYQQEGYLHHYPFGKEFADVYILAKWLNS